jgi:hypothetical protein
MVLYYEDNKADFDNVFNDMSFEQWQDYLKVHKTAVLPILPFIMKAVQKYGTDAFADFIVQLFFAYITHDDITIGDALQYVDFDQVVRSGFEGLISGKGWGLKAVKATISGISDMLLKWKKSKDYTIEQATNDFGLGFISALAGDALSQITGKFPPEKIARGLVKKFNISYSKVCSLMGKGLKTINTTFAIPSAHSGSVSAIRMMEGWASGKIAVIGRNMEERVKPFASNLSSALGVPVLTWQGYDFNLSNSENLANNRAWVKSLKEQGYTFYDIGLDSRNTQSGDFTTGIYWIIRSILTPLRAVDFSCDA